MTEANGCENCVHKKDESVSFYGKRIVRCELNYYQMYAPFVKECKHYQAK